MSISINIQQFNPLTFQLAQNEPVFITEHGKISNVVLSYEQYCQLNRQNLTIAEVFATPDAAADVAFELPKRADDLTLTTRNLVDFQGIDVDLLNPFAS